MSNILNENRINKAQDIVNDLLGDNTTVIRVRKDKGLIEKTSYETKKIILTEDNRQVICD